MNEPMRLSASGSPIARQLLRAGKRERPRSSAKLEAAAAAVLVGSQRWSLFTLLRNQWLAGARFGLCFVAASVGAWAVCARATTSDTTLEAEPLIRADVVVEVRARVPETFLLEDEPHAVTKKRPGESAMRILGERLPESTRPVSPREDRAPAAPKRAELDLLRDVRIALAGDDPARALATLDEHAKHYPLGALREEAAALRVEALARSGDASAARAAAARFRTLYPSSPYAERVRSIIERLRRP